MTDRDGLIELIRNAKAAMKAENLSCDIARNMFVADFLIANGVTVNEWRLASEPPKKMDSIFAHTILKSALNLNLKACWNITQPIKFRIFNIL